MEEKMKKTLFTIFTATALFGFADETDPVTTGFLRRPISNSSFSKESVDREGFVYVRFAAAESDLIHRSPLYPGLGIGYRRLAGDGAADISVSGIGHAERRRDRFVWTAPKVAYIRYFDPNATKSAYVGGGLAWGGVDAPENHFIGIIPNITAGYEFVRKTSFLGFSELTISQPALSVVRKGSFPGPCVEFSTGIGF